MPKNKAQLAAEHSTQTRHRPWPTGGPQSRHFLTVLAWPAIRSAIGAGGFARANCYGAKRL